MRCLLLLLTLLSGAGDAPAPELDSLWDYSDPALSEQRFRELLPRVEASGDAELLAQLLTQLARAQGLQRSYSEAHATLDRAAATIGSRHSRARVRLLLERGRVLNTAGDPIGGRALFVAALEQAGELGEDALAVDAAHMLAIVEPPEVALEWNRRAIALAEASEDPAARRWRGSLLNNTGWALHDLGRFEEALAVFERAVEVRREQGAAEPLRVARWSVARTLRSLERYQEALAIQRELAAGLQAAGSEDGYVDEELGELLLALGRRAEARPHFARAWELLGKDTWLSEKEPERLQRLRRLAGGESD